MKTNFAMYLKTYSEDFSRCKSRMIESFNRYNAENIRLYVSVPENDMELFKQFESDTIKIITDESYAKNYFTDESYFGLSEGYINQEICKLSFWETNLAENYLCVDSDVEFIRNFYVSDFMADENTPYTILVQDKDLAIERHYHGFWLHRFDLIKKIYDEVDLDDRRYRTCHGMQVLNSKVLKSLKEDFMSVKNGDGGGYSYKDLIKISPYEFTWYNCWFQKCKLVRECAVEPFFKTFHMRIEYIISRFKNLRLEDYAYSYVGIILNGNWERPEKEYKNPNVIHKFFYTKILKRL